MKSVWIVYQMVPYDNAPGSYKWVDAVFETKDEVDLYIKRSSKDLDSRFGMAYQEWFLDKLEED